jgi:nitrite reductase (NADH) large subunit
MFSIGQVNPEDASFRACDIEAEGSYCRFVIHDNRLVGAVLLGDTKLTATVKEAVEGKKDLSEFVGSVQPLMSGPAADEMGKLRYGDGS